MKKIAIVDSHHHLWDLDSKETHYPWLSGNEDEAFNSVIYQKNSLNSEPILGNLVNSNNFISRQKYSMKNFVIADFSSIQNNFKLNKLYTTVMIGVSFATFIFLTYGLSSSITTIS